MSYYTKKITEHIQEIRCDRIPGCLTNSYVIGSPKANYLIDSGLGSSTAREMMKYLDITKPTYLINTHYHWDHIWGNAYFDDAIVICHELCVENIQRNWQSMVETKKQFIDGETRGFEVHITFNARLTLNNELDLIFTPGHTVDSISAFYREDKALFVGDLIGDDDAELVPSVKDPDNFIASLDRCMAIDPVLYISGHHEVQRKGILERIRDLYLGENP
jgi:glyoxylase-like metal-dependent hydrolase (beta-lactamase superfamily II)